MIKTEVSLLFPTNINLERSVYKLCSEEPLVTVSTFGICFRCNLF